MTSCNANKAGCLALRKVRTSSPTWALSALVRPNTKRHLTRHFRPEKTEDKSTQEQDARTAVCKRRTQSMRVMMIHPELKIGERSIARRVDQMAEAGLLLRGLHLGFISKRAMCQYSVVRPDVTRGASSGARTLFQLNISTSIDGD